MANETADAFDWYCKALGVMAAATQNGEFGQ